ncbi:RCC1 domain-containing protein [Acetatifactor aquisgranensis]|uniref:RCC1 domain-containing protein n=1 Tax=Acetatifactor aquisgranensis TaxID=2941233 RepID=UPI00203A7A98|nr:RCC1 domain-containing protein [Acetatifactor aquisgranensis]
MKEDRTVWTWGTVYFEGSYYSPNVYYLQNPQKILEDAVLVTGGWFNHAALLRDGTVWTWGYNMSGNCGVADLAPIGEPTMVAEDVVMVWTDLALNNYPQPGAEDIAMAWTGGLRYDMEHDDIAELGISIQSI